MRSHRYAARRCTGLLSSVLCCLLVVSPAVSALQGGKGAGGGNRPTKGAPGDNLPNLDEVRRRGPARPKAQPPVPSNLKKCPPDKPDCNAPARTAAAGDLEETVPTDGATPNKSLLGTLVAVASNPFAGILLASSSAFVPEPPRTRGVASQRPAARGWFPTLSSLFGVSRMPFGGFENADCISAWGWAWDSAQPNTPIMVALYADGQLVATTLADRLRSDIIPTTNDDGRHGFRFILPDSLRDGNSHTLSVKIQGTDYTLGYSPKIISSCVVSYEGAITAADCDRITGWAWDAGRPSTPIDVDVYVDGAFAARASADTYNLQLNKGDDNRHQFSVPTPLVARDGQSHSVTIRPANSAQTLGSATTGACNGPGYEGYLDYADCEVVAGWAVDHNKLNTPVSVDIYAGPTFVTRVLADNFRQDIANFIHDNGRHGFVVPVPDSLRDGVPHQFTAVAAGSTYNLNVLAGPVTCSARAGCSASQSLASTEFVKDFYLGTLARQPRPLELQFWNDSLKAAAAQGQTALRAKAKLLGRELFLEGEYAGRGRMAAGQEASYVSDLYWSYLQRGPDATGQNSWVQSIQTQNAQGQNGWLGALTAFEEAGEFNARVASVCPSPAESVKSYDPAGDFSPLQNPDGAWSYGYRPASGGAFTRYPAHGAVSVFDQGGWYDPAISDPYFTPQVNHATLSTVVGMHPGPQGQKSVVRWTAPTAGTYIVNGRFQNQDNATTDVHVAHNSNGSTVALFDGQINGGGSTAPFNVTRTVAAGETIDFSVGFGSNNNYGSDSTGLVVTISQPPPTQTQPYNGTAVQAPGRIEAELFDAGGEGVAYHDTTPGTHGQDYDQPPNYPPPSFRQPTDVDIYKQAAGFSNGYLVMMQAGDWMNYTVNVAQPGSYTLSARVAWGNVTGGTFHIEVDGVDATGPLQIPNTSWILQTLTKSGVQLASGRHVLRVVADTDSSAGYTGDLDYLSLTSDSDPGLVARWAFDEGTGLTAADSTGNGNTGTLQNGAAWAAGKVGTGAASFDGVDDYVQVGANTGLVLTTAATFGAWLYPTGGGSGAASGGAIVNKEGEYEVARFADGTIQWAIANSSNTWGWVNTGFVAPLNQWTHVVITCDGAAVKTYANGQLVHSAAWSGGIGDAIPAQNDFRVGGRQATPQNFKGRLDDVRVYARALSSAEVAALVASYPADPTGNDFSEAKKDPANQTGAGGDDPLSRNFNFTVPLVGLGGRAGLDLQISLSYNSLVWTRDAATGAVKFDADYGDPSPGFRLGLPVIRGKYLNARGENAYMLITPSGGRVELRQLGTTNVYESTDSSYTRLTEDSGLTLRPADGSQLTFALKGYAYRCTQVKDANGNFISVSYDAANNVSSMTDTLGRVLTFSYDANGRPLAIEQNWGGQVHQWATFGYTNLTLGTQFADPSKVTGPASGTAVSVLNRVSLQDGSRHDFLYNSWAQVYRAEYHAPDGRLLTYTEYDLAAPTSAQTNGWTDCPRFTQRRDFVKDWNGDAPAVTTYGVEAGAQTVVTQNGTLPNAQAADLVKQKFFYGPSGSWRSGLVEKVETYSTRRDGQNADPNVYDLRRTAQTLWTQDDESLNYRLNPRVKRSEVSDPQGNHTGASYEYTSYGLTSETREWSGSEANVLRRTHVEYNLDSAYVNRRMLGLVSSASLYDEQGHVVWKVDNTYDQGGDYLRHQGEPVQHDGTNYGATFVIGRGLLTSVRRWDANALHDVTKSVESRLGYNTTGSVIFSRDPLGHGPSISYADRFADKAGTNTLAYPTAVTDAGNNTSKAEYGFYTGLVSRTENPKGAQQTFTYDAAGRTLRAEVSGRNASTNQAVSGGYTRWVYSDSMDAVQSWTQADTGRPEVCSITIADGAGRVRATASDFPGSQGGYRAQYTSYDIAGRVSARSNPAEVNGLWNPSGEDAAGWNWTTQVYDWKSRPLLITNPGNPSTTRDFYYGGCGCAGGEVTVARDEVGRRQKVTSDALGRVVKAQELTTLSKSQPLDGGTDADVLSTVTNTFDALDHVTEVRQQGGVNGVAQVTTMTFDGHGRLKTRRLPQYDAGTLTTYEYGLDDTVQSVTDPRGVVTSYSYNSRRLLTGVAYAPGPSGVADTPDISFTYDENGSRTSMSDGTGSITYAYDGLSRLTSETRRFHTLLTSPGTPTEREYVTAYGYTTSGQLKYLIDPAGSRVDYDYDTAGQTLGVRGSGPASAAAYASNMRYRAWGGLKDVDYGNQTHQYVGYDARLRAATMELRNVKGSPSQTSLTLRWDYDYYADGRLNHAFDLNDNRFDRKLDYDDRGRLKEAYTGAEARGQAPASPPNSPYRQSFGYDSWNNMTARSGRLWKQTLPAELSEYGADNRRDGWDYDAAGNLEQSDSHVDAYDAAGNQVYSHAPAGGSCSPYDYEITQAYDGEGRPAHRVQTKRTDTGASQCAAEVEEIYYVYSAALGGAKLLELNTNGEKTKGYVYGGGGVLLAKQEIYPSLNSSGVKWQHQNPGSESWVETAPDRAYERQEMDPLGAEVGAADPFLIVPDPNYTDLHADAPMFVDGGDPFHLSDGCGDIDGMPASCTEVRERMEAGSVAEQYLIHDPQGFSTPQLTPVPLGLGLFGSEQPSFVSNVDNEWRPGDPVSRLDWRNRMFSLQPSNPGPDSIGPPCSPTAKQLAKLPQVKKALEAAWKRSNYGTPNAREEGGWIFADSSGRIRIMNAPSGADDHIDLRNAPLPPSTPGQGHGSMFGAQVGRSTVPFDGWRLVGIFHTHIGVEGQPIPSSGGRDFYGPPQDPSDGDGLYSKNRGNLPGIIRTQVGTQAVVTAYEAEPGVNNPCPD